MTNGIQLDRSIGSVVMTLAKVSSAGVEKSAGSKCTEALSATPKLSSLARQLSESAERARIRDGTLSRQQLGDLGREIGYKVSNGCAPEIKARRAQEVPDTDDPERLERALQATRFVANNYQADSRVINPFAGLSREQLTLIVYDENGGYTLNERDAAKVSIKQLERPWRERVLADAQLERSQTGGAPNFYRACVAHYRALPKIEQAMHHPDYEANNLRFIEEDLEAQRSGKKDQPMLTLIEVLARINRKLPVPVAGGENPSPAARIDNAEEIKT
ncbi:hypothetical protein M2401_003266 [Pseudomonas sp. JUb42]|uniref:hypothetical protein n=1 Tax=Pseudomonas sp. JUb42 TaxID=2940611 RepID=UPI00216927ED|nr:hypothetical protein [Pseudomonas sp. JUb42]MCS3469528.1 hypothetical protein [Pseudomonas sp. JUb42]